VPCLLAVVVGAMVQGALGFGLALVAVPVLAWLAPSTVPVGILVAVLPLVLVAALRERARVDVRGLAVVLVGRDARSRGSPRRRARGCRPSRCRCPRHRRGRQRIRGHHRRHRRAADGPGVPARRADRGCGPRCRRFSLWGPC
jgi:hypothetical protein